MHLALEPGPRRGSNHFGHHGRGVGPHRNRRGHSEGKSGLDRYSGENGSGAIDASSSCAGKSGASTARWLIFTTVSVCEVCGAVSGTPKHNTVPDNALE